MGGLRESGRMGTGGTSLFTLFSLVVVGFWFFFLSAGIVFKERKKPTRKHFSETYFL